MARRTPSTTSNDATSAQTAAAQSPRAQFHAQQTSDATSPAGTPLPPAGLPTGARMPFVGNGGISDRYAVGSGQGFDGKPGVNAGGAAQVPITPARLDNQAMAVQHNTPSAKPVSLSMLSLDEAVAAKRVHQPRPLAQHLQALMSSCAYKDGNSSAPASAWMSAACPSPPSAMRMASTTGAQSLLIPQHGSDQAGRRSNSDPGLEWVLPQPDRQQQPSLTSLPENRQLHLGAGPLNAQPMLGLAGLANSAAPSVAAGVSPAARAAAMLGASGLLAKRPSTVAAMVAAASTASTSYSLAAHNAQRQQGGNGGSNPSSLQFQAVDLTPPDRAPALQRSTTAPANVLEPLVPHGSGSNSAEPSDSDGPLPTLANALGRKRSHTAAVAPGMMLQHQQQQDHHQQSGNHTPSPTLGAYGAAGPGSAMAHAQQRQQQQQHYQPLGLQRGASPTACATTFAALEIKETRSPRNLVMFGGQSGPQHQHPLSLSTGGHTAVGDSTCPLTAAIRAKVAARAQQLPGTQQLLTGIKRGATSKAMPVQTLSSITPGIEGPSHNHSLLLQHSRSMSMPNGMYQQQLSYAAGANGNTSMPHGASAAANGAHHSNAPSGPNSGGNVAASLLLAHGMPGEHLEGVASAPDVMHHAAAQGNQAPPGATPSGTQPFASPGAAQRRQRVALRTNGGRPSNKFASMKELINGEPSQQQQSQNQHQQQQQQTQSPTAVVPIAAFKSCPQQPWSLGMPKLPELTHSHPQLYFSTGSDSQAQQQQQQQQEASCGGALASTGSGGAADDLLPPALFDDAVMAVDDDDDLQGFLTSFLDGPEDDPMFADAAAEAALGSGAFGDAMLGGPQSGDMHLGGGHQGGQGQHQHRHALQLHDTLDVEQRQLQHEAQVLLGMDFGNEVVPALRLGGGPSRGAMAVSSAPVLRLGGSAAMEL